MKILITGSNGQLGSEFVRKLSPVHSVFGLNKVQIDITNYEKMKNYILELKPELIIHCAAFTAVDSCETEWVKALEVNGLATGYLAAAAEKIGARLLYISTDYVFDGIKESPYKETDTPDPQSVYGLSKWLGEIFVLKMKKGTVIRTSWLYGHNGRNFVKTMLNFAKQNKKVKVVNDQIGSPTYVDDLVETILQLFDKENGIYHISNSGECSWFEFAQEVYKHASANPKLVIPTTTKEYGALARRPKYSALAKEGLKNIQVTIPRHWRDALADFLRKETAK
ncbi:dTDP-4-dehydrorhamnose reductase [Neobacillus mesonae]|uniref:dTDP-4-dehydrorhamnose reductase n=1 Tax=Neobacillus mesonae TaxID=1193713 RepID=UPI002E229441|nr:dTDP-4-dehydrorhamnose reductase [Neobacillus mesonae]MED4206765.1 dTDP-4-dehydrorhamnose reductase [Neobacillus mesonae]